MASIEAIRDRLDVEDADAVELEAIGAEGMEVSVPPRGSARPIFQDMIKHLCSSISYGGADSLCDLRASVAADPAPLPDPAHRVVSPRVVRALRAMSGLARLAPTSSRLFAHATAGMFIFGLVLALPGTLFGMPAWTASVGCDVAAQANLLVVFFAGQLTCTAAAGIAVDHFGAQRVLTAGTGLLALGFLALAGSNGARRRGRGVCAARRRRLDDQRRQQHARLRDVRRTPWRDAVAARRLLRHRGVPRSIRHRRHGRRERLTALGALGVVLTVAPLAIDRRGLDVDAASPCARCWPLPAIITLAG